MRQSLVVHTLLVAALVLFAVVACPGAAPPASAQLGTTVIFFDDFESGPDGWGPDNGVWEWGQPTDRPSEAQSPENCWGTVLDGDFPANINSRLISPEIQLPTLTGQDELWLQFWTWADYLSNYADVELNYQLPGGTWSGWCDLDTGYGFTYPDWSRVWVDLSYYAGKTVRIGFRHYPGDLVSSGWSIDDVQISVETPRFRRPENFESGWDGWHADNGVWEVGTPTAGPGGAHSGTTCIGTVLDGTFPAYVPSRVTTPSIRLPGIPNPNPENEKLWLQFWTWADYLSNYADVELNYQLPDGTWYGWCDLDTGYGFSYPDWSPVRDLDLSYYAGKTVRIGFRHYPGDLVSSGWYIDDVTILAHTDTVGLYNPATGTSFLRNSNTAGAADLTLRFGPAPNTWTPLSGNWDADWDDTIGLYDPAGGKFYLRNSNSGGPADLTFRFGPAASTWLPITGDWDGDGIDTIGLYSQATGTFYLRNSNSAGVANRTFRFGPVSSTWLPIAGDWDNDGIDTIGLYSPTTGTFYLRNDNSAGIANRTFRFGPAPSTWKPIVGEWHAD